MAARFRVAVLGGSLPRDTLHKITIDDIDLWRAAQLLVKRHGADAPVVAAQRADELFSENDFEGGCRMATDSRGRRGTPTRRAQAGRARWAHSDISGSI